MLSPITAPVLGGLRQLADKMEKILLVALDSYGNTFVEPKVELGARFGHLVRAYHHVFSHRFLITHANCDPQSVSLICIK